MSSVQVGMGPREAEELFELFDVDGSGGIDDKEFMKVGSHGGFWLRLGQSCTYLVQFPCESAN